MRAQGRPYPKTDRKGDTLGAINLGQRGYRRVGHSHLQGARKRQADHDDGARQHGDRDQSAFAVASHNKRAHPLVERRAPPTKGESTRSAGWAQASMHQPSTSCVSARRRRAADERDELAPLHSITSSARASSVGGTSRPSSSAVLRLITSSYFVGACTGRSAGFSPFKMRST